MRALIVHSPLVGPSTVAPLAVAVEAVGWTTTVPDLRTAIGSPTQFRRRAISAGHAIDVVIGHSGAGAFLPVIADELQASAVFVDAVVPAGEQVFVPSAAMVRFLDNLPVADGLLPPWDQWWPAELMAELVPDDTLRRRVTAEIPHVPRSFYDEAVPLPPQWSTRAAAYLQLSPAYDDDRTRAEAWSWPTITVAGRHLDLCVNPALIADHIINLVSQLDQGAR